MDKTGHCRPRNIMGVSDARDDYELLPVFLPFVIINTQIITCQLP